MVQNQQFITIFQHFFEKMLNFSSYKRLWIKMSKGVLFDIYLSRKFFYFKI